MAKPLAIDNSKLREEARQQRREQARLQQPPEKQPTKNLFGPPIPVSRPNDPTFEQLSNFFGSPVGADISCFRSSSNNDCSPTDRSSQGHRPSVMRHGDARDAAAVEHSNSRRTEHRQNESRHGGDARHADARQGDTRHGDIKHRDRPSDGRNIGSSEPAVRVSRPGRGVAVPSLDVVEPSRQGVFEQFVKSSSSKTPSTVESDGVVVKTSGTRQPTTHVKTKHRTSSFNDSKPEELSSGSRSTGFRPEGQSKQQPAANQSKCSSDIVPDPSRNVSPPPLSSSFPSGRMNGVRKEMNGSPSDQRTAFGKGNEKPSGGRANGIHPGADLNGKNSDVEKKLRLHISKEYEKCDDLVTKVLQAVTIRSPLTGILTPKKTDFSFSFPNTTQQFNETIPEGFLSSDEDDGRDIVMVDHGPVQRPERPCDYAGKTIPNQSSSVLHDLNISDSSDSEAEQVEESSAAQRTPDGAGQRSATEPKLPGSVPSAGNAKGRRQSESSEGSSTEGSGTSGSESDSSQSDNEDDGAVKQTGDTVKDEDDEADDKQMSKRTWEIENFIPKNKKQVPFMLSSSPPSPPFAGVNRQTSNTGFDIDINDPIKEMYMMSPQQVLSPMLTSDVEPAESCHSPDVVCPSSPKIPPSPKIAVNRPRPVASPADLSHADLFSSSVLASKSCAHSPEPGTSFLAPISGVEYRAGNPSVVVRIRRSYLLKKAKNAKIRDITSNGTSRTTNVAQVGTSALSSRSATPRSQAQTGRGPDVSWYSPESAMKPDRASDTSVPRNPSCRSSAPLHTRVPEATPERISVVPAPSSFELAPAARKESRIESSPAKCSQDETATDVTHPISSKATKRKLDDVGRLDSKKICDRRKEERKSQSSQLQNGNADKNSQKLLLVAPDFKIESKSPMTNGEDNNSRSSSSSSSSNVQKRTERTKVQNGRPRPDDKTRKSSSSKVNGKVSVSETPSSVSNRSAKGTTPVVNGIGESPSDPNPDICGENGLSVSGDVDDIGKRSRDHDDSVDRLTFDPKNSSLNGIRRFKFEPEKLESSDYYMRNARKLKHEGDSRPDKFLKVLNYTESVLAFLCHCSALEAEHAEFARIHKMYHDTLSLCQYVVRVMESVVGPEKYHLIAINLRIQAIINLRLYSIRKADVAKLKCVLDEHNKSHMSKPLQIPSPYQTNHHHSTNNTAASAAVSWNHANGTPSPRSPRPSPSPAGSIGSVGSAGSSNGDNIGMAKPLSVVNGHSLTSIVVPQRIHSVMMNFMNYMNFLHQCLDFWDQAEAILVAHPAVGDFFHSVDREFGPIDLHSPALAIVRYASEVVTHVRSEVKRTSQVVRTD